MDGVNDIKVSLRRYPSAIFPHCWVLIIGGIGGIVRLIQERWPEFMIPDWAWIGLLSVSVAIAQFLAWHKLRVSKEIRRADGLTRLNECRAMGTRLINLQVVPSYDDVVEFRCSEHQWLTFTEGELRAIVSENAARAWRDDPRLSAQLLTVGANTFGHDHQRRLLFIVARRDLLDDIIKNYKIDHNIR